MWNLQMAEVTSSLVLVLGVEDHNSNTNHPMKLLVDLSEFSAPP
jgi:hypothetical protein